MVLVGSKFIHRFCAFFRVIHYIFVKFSMIFMPITPHIYFHTEDKEDLQNDKIRNTIFFKYITLAEVYHIPTQNTCMYYLEFTDEVLSKLRVCLGFCPTQDTLELSSEQMKESTMLKSWHTECYTSVLRVESYDSNFPSLKQILIVSC